MGIRVRTSFTSQCFSKEKLLTFGLSHARTCQNSLVQSPTVIFSVEQLRSLCEARLPCFDLLSNVRSPLVPSQAFPLAVYFGCSKTPPLVLAVNTCLGEPLTGHPNHLHGRWLGQPDHDSCWFSKQAKLFNYNSFLQLSNLFCLSLPRVVYPWDSEKEGRYVGPKWERWKRVWLLIQLHWPIIFTLVKSRGPAKPQILCKFQKLPFLSQVISTSQINPDGSR